MYERVNPEHPDKICDRIAGALVDLAYSKNGNPKVAVEVLLGHGHCHIINETDTHLKKKEVKAIVRRITNNRKVKIDYKEVKQDYALASNQSFTFARCGDNGIFVGMPITEEQKELAKIAYNIYATYPYDGKYIVNDDTSDLFICQSHASFSELCAMYPNATRVNPLGYWTGGTDVDTGAVNRKLGSDMGDSITGGGLHGKDLSKADVSVNIYAFLKAQKTQKPVKLFCAIGDEFIDGKPYHEIIRIAKEYIDSIGGFEKFAEWGLIR